jgi:hypothetical protein
VLYKLVIKTKLAVLSQILTVLPIASMAVSSLRIGWFLAMSVGEFQRRLHGAKYAQNDLKYFPLWVRRYAEAVTPENQRLPVSVESVKEFSRSLLQSVAPAWQAL